MVSKRIRLLREAAELLISASIDCERCFSTSGYFANKFRSLMSAELLDCLCFLKYDFLHNKDL